MLDNSKWGKVPPAAFASDLVSGSPVNVLTYGADPTGVADSTTAFADAYAAVVADGGGVVYVPRGFYLVSQMPAWGHNGVSLRCESPGELGGGTTISQTSTVGDFLTITGANDWVDDCFFKPSVRTTGFQIVFRGAFQGGTRRVKTYYAYNGVKIDGSSEVRISSLTNKFMLGTQGYVYTGTAGAPSYGHVFDHYLADNPYPATGVLVYDHVVTWSTNLSVAQGQVVYVNGNVYQAANNGITAAVGAGPSGFPAGTTPESAFTNTITDGTVQWYFVSQTLNALVWDSYAYSLRGYTAVLMDGYGGLLISDTANTGTSYPKFGELNDIETDHNYTDGQRIWAGVNFQMVNGYCGTSATGNGISTQPPFKGELVIDASRCMGNAMNGILINTGKHITITNNFLMSNSMKTSGFYHGVAVGNSVTNFIIKDNHAGTDDDTVSNQQGYGVFVNGGGVADYYDIEGNICGGQNISGCVKDYALGARRTVQNDDNTGFTSQQASPLFSGTVTFNNNPAVGPALSSGCANPMTVAGGAMGALPTGSGEVLVIDPSTGENGKYLLGGNSVKFVGSSQNGVKWVDSSCSPGAGQESICYSSGYKIVNNTGASRDYCVFETIIRNFN
jgi:hypothetical protein